jgi:hypothetical protein
MIHEREPKTAGAHALPPFSNSEKSPVGALA